jgi:hypothetical protein
MALKKEIRTGDELEFECGNIAEGASKNINVMLTEVVGRRAILKIRADRSIPIIHHKNSQPKSEFRG